MRNFKKFLTLALAVVMVASMFAFGASAAKFTDVDENNEYLAKAVNLLNYVGVAKGTTDTTFGTDELVTREQMAAFIYRLMKKGQSVEGGDNTSSFTDLEDSTFFFMVSWANNQGIIKGTSATTFDPKGSITLQDAYTMIVRALGYEKEETLPYPYGYIDVAEQKGVELDEGLSSTVTYTDALTRGDVAILLYNAFFAETGVAETKQVEREIGTGANATWVLETKTTYPTLCEKVFDVLEVEYQAVATPGYAFNETETTSGLGYDAILFDYVDDEATDAPAQFYAAVEDLGLDGDADDYIMAHFNMYIILDDDNAVDEILYAEPLMTSKTVSEIKLETLSSNTAKSYYGDNADNAKRLSGKVLIDGKEAYFYNAPYSYAKPTYGTGMSDVDKYLVRNEKNLQFIEKSVLGDVDDKEYQYVLDTAAFVDVDDDYFSNDSVTLVEKLSQVYTGGLYEATVYDVDGDGLYDYIEYMPYDFAFVDTDDDYNFYDDGEYDDGGKPTIYTYDAVIEGETFSDGDFVIGYFNQAANYIKVATVIDPVTANVTDIKSASGNITLSTGDTVSANTAWKLVVRYAQNAELAANGYKVSKVDWTDFDDSLLSASAYDADDAEFYIYDGVVLFQDGIDSKITFNSNLIILTADEDGKVFETGAFNSTTGKKVTYAYAWVDGELGYIALDTDAEIYAKNANGEVLSIKNAAALSAAEAVDPDVNPYYNRVATYAVDGNGLYTIKVLGNAYDDKAAAAEDYIGIDSNPEDLEDEKDDNLQFYGEVDNGYLVKYATKRFQIKDADASGAAKLVPFDLMIGSNAIIVIRNEYVNSDAETEIKFYTYDATTLSQTIINQLENIQYVVSNNADYTTREDLVLLFAEVNGEEIDLKGTTSSKSERIVKTWDIKLNADKKYYVEYTLYNPYTGATETVPGSKTSTSSSFTTAYTYGDVVTVASGEVDESKAKVGNVKTAEQLYWVVDYNDEDGVLEVVPYGDENGKTYLFDMDTATAVKIGNQTNNDDDMLRFGAFAKLDIAQLGSTDKGLKAVNTTYSDPDKENAPIKTVYGKYIKAYVQVDWEDDGNHDKKDSDTNCNGTAKFVAVIANSGEKTDYCDLK